MPTFSRAAFGVRQLTSTAGVFVLAASLLPLTARAVPLDPAKSSVMAISRQMNVPVSGTFRKVSGDVSFDPRQPNTASAHVDIDVASYDLGSDDYNKILRGKAWFDAIAYPHAKFVSTSISATGPGKLNVTGKLTIKGKTVDVTLPVVYSQSGGSQVFDGTLGIKRLTFGIGDGEWKDTSVVADDVTIKFHLTSRPIQ